MLLIHIIFNEKKILLDGDENDGDEYEALGGPYDGDGTRKIHFFKKEIINQFYVIFFISNKLN